MKALVTGATGFIGSTLVEMLLNQGIACRCLIRPRASLSNLEGLTIERIPGGLFDSEALRKAVVGTDIVFHVAGLTKAVSPREYFKVNTEGTRRLAEAVAESGTRPRVIFVSSLAAGGPAGNEKGRTEADQDAPISAYGQSKLAGEEHLLRYKDKFPITIARPPMVYGPRDKASFLFIKAAKRGLVPMLPPWREENKYYSFVHVTDLCKGLIQAALRENHAPSGDVFYMSGSAPASFNEFVSTVEATLGRKALRLSLPKPLFAAAACGASLFSVMTRIPLHFNVEKLKELRPDYWTCSNEKARRTFGFDPKFTLDLGLADAVDWYKKKNWI